MTQADRMWRRVVIWSAVAVCLAGIAAVLALTIASKVVSDAQDTVGQTRIENMELRQRVDANNRQAECRSRLANAAELIRAERDSLGWQTLVERVSGGPTADLTERANRMAELNASLARISELRTRSIEICNQDPGFMPPS